MSYGFKEVGEGRCPICHKQSFFDIWRGTPVDNAICKNCGTHIAFGICAKDVGLRISIQSVKIELGGSDN